MAYNKNRYPMPAVRRAKQFQPFDALAGFKEAIAATERFTEPKRELADYRIEQINAKLTELKKGTVVIVTYYGNQEEKYLQLTGSVLEIDPYWGSLRIGDETIDFPEIYELEILKSA